MARRAPAADERKRDADRTREKILQAAVEEFSEHGFAGARVSSIAHRAGVNQQLISYYFNGKAGLYKALTDRWRVVSAEMSPEAQTFAEVVGNFLTQGPQQRQWARLLLWEGLTGGEPADTPFFQAMVEELKRRQAAGEIAGELDPGIIQLVIFGAALAPVAIPHVAEAMTGMPADSEEFAQAYREQVMKIVKRLA